MRVVNDSGLPDVVAPGAVQTPVEQLPEETLVFLLGSRYCETDQLSDIAWERSASRPTGWARVQAICDFVHSHIEFGYQHARATRTAWEAYNEGVGVCRDYAHLAVALCRCMNIPARYCTGYLGDIGVPPPYGPMDFAGWFEAWLGGRWYTFDARNNVPRIGRVLMARGRDASRRGADPPPSAPTCSKASRSGPTRWCPPRAVDSLAARRRSPAAPRRSARAAPHRRARRSASAGR